MKRTYPKLVPPVVNWTKVTEWSVGLYVCNNCGAVVNADVNGDENIRKKITQNPGKDMSNGSVAQPSTNLFDGTVGIFQPKE